MGDSINDDAPINPEKHKMMASVVVNMRMHDPNLQRRDALGNRDSETDISMTDTEGTGADVTTSFCGTDHLSVQHDHDDPLSQLSLAEDYSSERGCLNAGEDEILYMDPLAPPATEAPVLVRRRHKQVLSSF